MLRPGSTPKESTRLLQSALDAAADHGGGTIVIAGGTVWEIGTVYLRSNVAIELEAGSVLRASSDPQDFASISVAGEYGGNEGAFLLYGEDLDGVMISGAGRIDGRALDFTDGWQDEEQRYIRRPLSWRPRGIGLFRSRNVKIRDVTIVDAAQWTVHLTGCEDVLISGITIRNRLDMPNCDGIDPDHCRNVRIADCDIEAGDDAVVIKNTREHRELGPTENIIISGCRLVSTSSGVKIGTESHGAFRNIIVSDCLVRDSHRGLAIQVRDTGPVEHVRFSNCRVETRLFHRKWWGRGEPIYITALPRHDGDDPPLVRNVSFDGIDCDAEHGVFCVGTAARPLEDLQFRNIRLRMGRKTGWDASERDVRPAHSEEHGGLENDRVDAVRLEHVDGVTISGFSVSWGERRTEYSGLLGLENVYTLTVDGLSGGVPWA